MYVLNTAETVCPHLNHNENKLIFQYDNIVNTNDPSLGWLTDLTHYHIPIIINMYAYIHIPTTIEIQVRSYVRRTHWYNKNVVCYFLVGNAACEIFWKPFFGCWTNAPHASVISLETKFTGHIHAVKHRRIWTNVRKR